MSTDSSDADPGPGRYRATIRYRQRTQRYEIIEVEAADLRDALAKVKERFPPALVDTADLVEIRLANPVAE